MKITEKNQKETLYKSLRFIWQEKIAESFISQRIPILSKKKKKDDLWSKNCKNKWWVSDRKKTLLTSIKWDTKTLIQQKKKQLTFV